MSTYETAEIKFVTVNGVNFAYRQFGASSGVPLFLHIHFRGSMDHWDPALITPLSARRPILLIDNSGIGRSGGEIPPTFVGWAANIAGVVSSLGIRKIDALGFSMGGYTVQMLKLNHPQLVRRTILCGTAPSNGPGVTHGGNDVLRAIAFPTSEEGAAASVRDTFFPQTPEGRAAAGAFWARVLEARPYPSRSAFLDVKGGRLQMGVSRRFHAPDSRAEGSFDRLAEIRGRVMILNGSEDVVIPTQNSIVMFQQMVNARVELHLFPKSGHGFLYQHAARVAAVINAFLDEEGDDWEPDSREKL